LPFVLTFTWGPPGMFVDQPLLMIWMDLCFSFPSPTATRISCSYTSPVVMNGSLNRTSFGPPCPSPVVGEAEILPPHPLRMHERAMCGSSLPLHPTGRGPSGRSRTMASQALASLAADPRRTPFVRSTKIDSCSTDLSTSSIACGGNWVVDELAGPWRLNHIFRRADSMLSAGRGRSRAYGSAWAEQ